MHISFRAIAQVLLVLFLGVTGGCVLFSPSIPPGYKGETATIDDSFDSLGRSSVNLFFVSKIDDKNIRNAYEATNTASYGRGADLLPMGTSRQVMARPIKLHLVGRYHHALPIVTLATGDGESVAGEIEFTPQADQKYIVRGKIGKNESAIWLENIHGDRVSAVVTRRENMTSVSTNLPTETGTPSRREIFFSVKGGESNELIKAKLGEPNRIEHINANPFTRRISQIVYQYDDLGAIHFNNFKHDPLYVAQVFPQISSMEAEGDDELLKIDGATLRRYVKTRYKDGGLTEDESDLVVKKIWVSMDSEDPYTVDALAWLCKVIARDRNPRYRHALQEISKSASHDKLRRYAEKAIEDLPDQQVTQYMP